MRGENRLFDLPSFFPLRVSFWAEIWKYVRHRIETKCRRVRNTERSWKKMMKMMINVAHHRWDVRSTWSVCCCCCCCCSGSVVETLRRRNSVLAAPAANTQGSGEMSGVSGVGGVGLDTRGTTLLDCGRCGESVSDDKSPFAVGSWSASNRTVFWFSTRHEDVAQTST